MWGREPAAILGLIQAGLALAVGFGFELSNEQMGLVLAFSAALFAVITRSQVTSSATLEAAGTSKAQIVAAAESGKKP
jgi:hypothetical protein